MVLPGSAAARAAEIELKLPVCLASTRSMFCSVARANSKVSICMYRMHDYTSSGTARHGCSMSGQVSLLHPTMACASPAALATFADMTLLMTMAGTNLSNVMRLLQGGACGSMPPSVPPLSCVQQQAAGPNSNGALLFLLDLVPWHVVPLWMGYVSTAAGLLVPAAKVAGVPQSL